MKRLLATAAAVSACAIGLAVPANAQVNTDSVGAASSNPTGSATCIIPGIQLAGLVFQAAHAITETGLAVASVKPFTDPFDEPYVHPVLWQPLAALTCTTPAQNPDVSSLGGGGSVWPLGKGPGQ